MEIDFNKPHYLCSWDETAQVHTRETLFDEYKDTNLYDDPNDISGMEKWSFDENDNLSFVQLLDKFDALFDVGEWHLHKDNAKRVRNDNMIIQRIW